MATPLTIARETPAWGDPTVYPEPPSPGRIAAHKRARLERPIEDGTASPMADPDPIEQYRALLESALEEGTVRSADPDQIEAVANVTDHTPTP